jgi:outer membrane phospholipase A
MSDNPDIEEFRGYFDLQLKYGKADGFEVSSNLRKGTAGGKGSIQVDFTYPLDKFLFGNLNLYFQAQYFTGYGESLLLYDKEDSSFRFGFAVHR